MYSEAVISLAIMAAMLACTIQNSENMKLMFLKRAALKHGTLQRFFTQTNTSYRFPKKHLQKYKHVTFLHDVTILNQMNCNHATFLHSVTNLNQLHCNHATFLHSVTNLNQLHCNHATFLHSVTNLNQLHCNHATFLRATTNLNKLNPNHVTFLYDTINVNQFKEATTLNRQ